MNLITLAQKCACGGTVYAEALTDCVNKDVHVENGTCSQCFEDIPVSSSRVKPTCYTINTIGDDLIGKTTNNQHA